MVQLREIQLGENAFVEGLPTQPPLLYDYNTELIPGFA